MAEARRRDAWQRTAELMALIANIHRDRKKRPRPFTGDSFNPLSPKGKREAKSGVRLTVGKLDLLARVLTGKPLQE